MNNKALTRYKLLDDVRGEVIGVTPRLVHDFCEGYEVVDADDAAREIERLEGELVVERNNRRILNEVACTLGEHHTMTPVEAAKGLVLQREHLGARVWELEQTFSHYHVNRADEMDCCKQCGLDLRDPIHKRGFFDAK